MMLLLIGTVIAVGARASAADDPKVIYVSHEAVEKGGTLATGVDYRVSINTRTGTGQCEVHEKETDAFYVHSGTATVVTGGKAIDLKLSRPGQWLGTGIEGGETHQLVKGDVIVVPAGVPHWFKTVSAPAFVYHLVKIVQP